MFVEHLKLAEKNRRSCAVLMWKSQNEKVRLEEFITESKFAAETESKLSNLMTASITFNVVDAAVIPGKAFDTKTGISDCENAGGTRQRI